MFVTGAVWITCIVVWRIKLKIDRRESGTIQPGAQATHRNLSRLCVEGGAFLGYFMLIEVFILRLVRANPEPDSGAVLVSALITVVIAALAARLTVSRFWRGK
jgi:hypothetical protein